MVSLYPSLQMATEPQLDSTQLRISRRSDSSEKGKEGYCVVDLDARTVIDEVETSMIWMLER
jgi:hypothetical protein